MNETCEKCLWHDQCHTYRECCDFTPVDDDVDSAIESDRIDYRRAFFTYEKEEKVDFLSSQYISMKRGEYYF